jgi:dTDP-glucose pyrophosphorylase
MNNKLLFKKAMLKEDNTISEGIRNLEEIGIKIILILNDGGNLAGVVTDGDIRRGMLKGIGLDESLKSIMNPNPLVVTEEISEQNVKQIMHANRVLQVPIIDQSRAVVGLHLWELLEEKKQRANKMVIMAGGRGIRMMPHTESCPKPMLLVHGRPMLEHIILRAKKQGFNNIVISVNYLSCVIKDYFNNGAMFGVEIDYIDEKEQLGTAGALSKLEIQDNESIVVTNGDVLTNIDYGDLLDFHDENGAVATMAVREHEIINPYGVVELDNNNIINIVEKPILRSFINAGVYGLSKRAIAKMKKDKYYDMPKLFQLCKDQSDKIIAYPLHEAWIDVGRPEDYKLANGSNDK